MTFRALKYVASPQIPTPNPQFVDRLHEKLNYIKRAIFRNALSVTLNLRQC